MRIRKLKNCTEIKAGDSTILRELLHPDKDYPFDGRYSLAHAKLPVGTESDKHKLTTDEVYYILEGKGEMYVDGETVIVEKGDTIEIPPNAVQSIKNIGDCELLFLCIVDPAWRAEDEEIL
ncbi:MAG: cupin domain-containing protein [Calditrichaeota bacterium]|nr:MAG: cupin domain-containing protein [Calditrichota bacterium]